jgi:type II secretory pathway component PulM
MTPDELDKRIEFILQMQAQFQADVGQLATSLARCEANIDNLRGTVSELRISVSDLAGVVRDSIKISDDRFTRLDDRIGELTSAQKRTDERLNALISVVERHITGPDHPARA